jgi:hypothetical protein
MMILFWIACWYIFGVLAWTIFILNENRTYNYSSRDELSGTLLAGFLFGILGPIILIGVFIGWTKYESYKSCKKSNNDDHVGYYWRIHKCIGYERSMKHIGMPEKEIKEMFDFFNLNAQHKMEFEESEYYYISRHSNNDWGFNSTDKYYNMFPYVKNCEKMIFKGDVLLRKEKLERLKKLK